MQRQRTLMRNDGGASMGRGRLPMLAHVLGYARALRRAGLQSQHTHTATQKRAELHSTWTDD